MLVPSDGGSRMRKAFAVRSRMGLCFFVLGFFVVGLSANAAGNPYNIAGYISPAKLAGFGFPPGSECYDWNNLQTAYVYQMVRPMHYLYRYLVPGGDYVADWNIHGASSQPIEWFTQQSYPTSVPWNVRRALNYTRVRYWSYHLDRSGGNTVGQQGLPPEMLPQWHLDANGTHQEQFETWVTAHPGMIWLLGNEPECAETVGELGGQDALTDEEYVHFHHAYHTLILSLDPSAKFANAALAMTTTPTWNPNFTVENIIADWERVLSIYFTECGTEMPIDIWNMHLYAGAACENEGVYRAKFVTAIETFREFTLTTRSGHYSGCPMFLTEFNGRYGGTMEDTVRFIQDFKNDLSALWVRGILSEWFWFVSHDSGGWSYCSITTPDGAALSDTGEAYKEAALHWESHAPTAVNGWMMLD
jgi:hypothetical protein